MEGDHSLLFSWGRGKDGCLGLGVMGDKEEPMLISKSIDYEINQISTGKEHVMLLLEGKKIYTWGRNSFK